MRGFVPLSAGKARLWAADQEDQLKASQAQPGSGESDHLRRPAGGHVRENRSSAPG